MKTLQVSDRRPSFKPLLEDALRVLKGPLHNPEAKDFKKIVFAMKNCSFFREKFASQDALNDFVELAKFYVGYEAHKYGDVLLHDKEYADKLCVILDGSVEKIFQKPYGKVEEQLNEKRRGISFPGFDMSPLKGKNFLPSIKNPRVSINLGHNEAPTFVTHQRVTTPKTNSFSVKSLRLQRLHSQERESSVSSLEDEEGSAFEDLMKFIVEKNPELKRKYYAEDILRADQIKTLNTGDYFGESFCMPNHPRSNYMFAVASPKAHVLTLNKEDYHEIMRQLENRNYKKLEAFIKLFPTVEKEEIQRFSEYFSQKSFQADEVIYFQGASAQDLYIVQSGEVQLLRKPAESRERAGSSFMPRTSVVKDQVFGEEVLLLMETRQESAIASVSNTSVFVLQASLIPDIEKEFDGIFVDLKNRAEEKFQWRQKKAKELFERNESSSPSPSDSSPRHSLSPTKGIMKSLFNPRHSIQIPHRRSFLSEMSPTHSLSPINLSNSLTSSFSKAAPRKLSDDQLQQQTKKSELFKSRFGRTSVISGTANTTRAREKASYPQLGDISPGSDLKTMNFRNELYGSNSSLKRSQFSSEKLKPVCNKPAKNQTPFTAMLIKRGIV
jgi:CRP-like cAMP-binding protein